MYMLHEWMRRVVDVNFRDHILITDDNAKSNEASPQRIKRPLSRFSRRLIKTEAQSFHFVQHMHQVTSP